MSELNYSPDKKGRIFNIQRFSTHDGPGIRTTVFLKGCMLKCFWCQNPESQVMEPLLMHNYHMCKLCGSCVKSCPEGAISIEDGRVVTDRNICTACGKCTEVCLYKARSISGYEASVSEILDLVLKDEKSYRRSGGGVTISGGDPLYQHDFTLELLKAFKSRKLHTSIETCGCASWDILENILEYVDYIQYDLKCMDSDLHKEGTGAENELIVSNLKKASRLGKPLRIRMPLIPGYNDSPEYVRQLRSFLLENGIPVECAELLKYNRMGEEKFRYLEDTERLVEFEPQSDEYFEKLKRILYEGE